MNPTNPDKTFFISDTHFGHRAIIDLCGRPFADRDAMDAAMIKTWNNVVPHDGVVYHMGDFSFRSKTDTIEILKKLNGSIILIRGNHDHHATKPGLRERFADVRDYAEVKLADEFMILMHYPLESWNRMHYGSWHLHGHSHGNIPDFGKRMDMGVDARGVYTPMAFSTLKALMDARSVESRDHHQPRVDAAAKQA